MRIQFYSRVYKLLGSNSWSILRWFVIAAFTFFFHSFCTSLNIVYFIYKKKYNNKKAQTHSKKNEATPVDCDETIEVKWKRVFDRNLLVDVEKLYQKGAIHSLPIFKTNIKTYLNNVHKRTMHTFTEPHAPCKTNHMAMNFSSVLV